MKQATSQFDLFDADPGYRVSARVAPVRRTRGAKTTAYDDPETMAQKLEDSGQYRVLRKLSPRPLAEHTVDTHPRLAVLVDTETTGLQHSRDEVIEIGAVAFCYDDAGQIGNVVGVYSALSQPSIPIPPEITRLTGITDEMVAGQRFDLAELEAMIGPADLIIAHNAGFDRPFCEKLSPAFANKAWACSVSEIRWSNHGFEGNKLGYLVGQSGLFHNGHRATDDCHALLEVLARPLDDDDRTPFRELLEASACTRIRLFAENSPFGMKDTLKARGYRWSDGSDGGPKSWWIELSEDGLEEELTYLRKEVYQWDDAEPPLRRLTAFDRFRAR